jgi:hypothetical protein
LPAQILTSENKNDYIESLTQVKKQKNENYLIDSQIEQVLSLTQSNMELNLTETSINNKQNVKQTETTTSSCSLSSNNFSGKSTEELDKAATKIQSTFRGYKTRKDLNKQQLIQQKQPKKQKKRSNSESDNSLSTNKRPNLINDPQVAATKIQSTFRGYKTRKLLKNKKNSNGKHVDNNLNNNSDLITSDAVKSEEELFSEN